MRKIFLSLAALAALTCFADGAGTAATGDFETWVMLGDSITHGGYSTGYLQLFWDLRHPGNNIVFENHGHTGGYADSGIRILEQDVLKRNPAKVLVMFGMNDVWREQWESAEPGEEEARLRGDALRRYRERMTRIAELVGDRLVVVTPTPYDQYGNVEGNRATPLCNEPGLATIAAIAREIAATNHLKVVELHAPLTAAMKRQPEARFAGEDRVHPREWGHHVMTALIAEGLGESPVVEETRLAAAKDGVAFDYAPKALPFPVSPAYRAAEAFLPITERFNREMLFVEGLGAGEWELRTDGRLVGVFSADEFAKGVNLATLDTPNQRLVQAAKVKADRLNQIYICQRDCRMGAREKPGATGYGAYLKSVYDREKERLPALAAEAERLRAELRALRPAKCRVSVRRRAKTQPPVNAFVCIGNGDFEDDGAALMKLAKELGCNSPTDFVTFSLRCRPDLNDAKVQALAKRFIDTCHLYNIKVGMDTDPRIARDGFLRRWPDDRTQLVSFDPGYRPNLTDHMTGGTRGYEVLKEDLFDQRVLAKVYDLYNCDIFSPHLLPYVEELMATYRALGADTAMRDEWGEPPCYDPAFAANRAFWYSKNMAKAYHDYCGRSLRDDIVLMGTAPAGKEAERLQAVYKYCELLYLRNAEIERHHYATTKRLFGPDAYVSKHPTWFPAICPAEFHHNGLDWWAADRDFAQTDEITPLPARLGLAKKFGGSTWMNEGYQDAPEKYLAEVKRYALSGGRMVFHPVYGGSWGNDMPWAERRVAEYMSIFNQPGMKETLQKIKKVDRTTQAQLDSPVALVFGHFELMNWEGPAYRDWGEKTAYGLYAKGWAVDAYPSTELVAGTFRVDADGWLRVGHQRYRALVAKHLSALDLAYAKSFFAAAGVKTKLYVCEDDGATVAAVDADLAAAGAVRQPPAAEELKFMSSASSCVPGTSGKATLQDGTAVEF